MWAANLDLLLDLLLLDLQTQYGNVVPIGPKNILLGDADEMVRTSGLRSSWKRSDWFKNRDFDFENPSIVTMCEVDEHDRRKDKLLRAYEGCGGVDWEAVVDGELALLIEMLRALAVVKEGRLVDWTKVARY